MGAYVRLDRDERGFLGVKRTEGGREGFPIYVLYLVHIIDAYIQDATGVVAR